MPFKADQPVVEVMTDKATVEVPTPTAGVVKELKFKIGDVIKVESVILTLEASAGATTSADKTASASGKPGAQATVEKTPAPKNSGEVPGSANVNSTAGSQGSSNAGQTQSPKSFGQTQSPKGFEQTQSSNHSGKSSPSQNVTPQTNGAAPAEWRVLATPSTRRLAREVDVDINGLHGTGLAGRVTREDVMSSRSGGGNSGGGLEHVTPAAHLPTRSTVFGASPQDERIPLRGIRKKIAENMQMAKRVIPHFTLMDEIEVTDLVKMREGLKAEGEKLGVKVTYLPFVMKALIATCREFPMFNASIDDEAQEIVVKHGFHLGFAADTPNGLLVPVIKNADQKTILELSAEIVDLSKRARDGKLKSEEMKGSTITITNIGSVGGSYATPIINHPEVAILGMYKIQDKLFLKKDGSVGSTKVMNVTITADHRLIDGAQAAYFLKAFASRLQNPGRLILDMI